MSDDLPAIDRGLLRRLDWVSHAEPPKVPAPSSDTAFSSSPRIDISAILDAVQHTATSMASMAERIQELEAHTEAFSASNAEIEAQIQQLTIKLGGVVQQRDELAARLKAESERFKRLEDETAQHVARSSAFERDLDITRADLAKIIDAVGTAFGRFA